MATFRDTYKNIRSVNVFVRLRENITDPSHIWYRCKLYKWKCVMMTEDDFIIRIMGNNGNPRVTMTGLYNAEGIPKSNPDYPIDKSPI